MKAEALAFCAAVVGVFAAWDAIELATALGSRVTSMTAPLRGAREARADERRRLTAIAALVAGTAGWILAGPLLAIAITAATPFAVRRVLSAQARKRRTVLVDAAPVVARAVADALAARKLDPRRACRRLRRRRNRRRSARARGAEGRA